MLETCCVHAEDTMNVVSGQLVVTVSRLLCWKNTTTTTSATTAATVTTATDATTTTTTTTTISTSTTTTRCSEIRPLTQLTCNIL